MSAAIYLYQLRKGPVSLEGELSVEDLELESLDELIETSAPLHYKVTAELFNQDILVQGELRISLDCHCVRCLDSFVHTVEVMDWSCAIPLKGEDKVEVKGDLVDLRPFIREDILLAFPQHPLCRPECQPSGYSVESDPKSKPLDEAEAEEDSTWAELDKLKL